MRFNKYSTQASREQSALVNQQLVQTSVVVLAATNRLMALQICQASTQRLHSAGIATDVGGTVGLPLVPNIYRNESVREQSLFSVISPTWAAMFSISAILPLVTCAWPPTSSVPTTLKLLSLVPSLSCVEELATTKKGTWVSPTCCVGRSAITKREQSAFRTCCVGRSATTKREYGPPKPVVSQVSQHLTGITVQPHLL